MPKKEAEIKYTKLSPVFSKLSGLLLHGIQVGKRQLIGCSQSFCQDNQSLALQGGPRQPLHSYGFGGDLCSRQENKSLQSAYSSRCAVHLFSIIQISGSPSFMFWFVTSASQSQTLCANKKILPLILQSSCFSLQS